MRKLWKNKPVLIGIAAIALFVLLAALTMGKRTEKGAWDLFGQAAMPVQTFVHGLTDDVTAFFVRVFRPSELEQENAALRAELTEQKMKNALLEETMRENARLTELLDFADSNTGMYYVTAKVIARSEGASVDTLTLNVGTRNGVTEKMAVVVSDGIVGRVAEVGTTWCKVRTMLNDDMRISVMVEQTRDEGMLGGLVLDGGGMVGLQLYYLPAGAVVTAGDRVLTSGLGGVFPRGLFVGEVLYAATAEDGAYDACVSTDVDFVHLEEVLVILGMDEVGVS